MMGVYQEESQLLADFLEETVSGRVRLGCPFVWAILFLFILSCTKKTMLFSFKFCVVSFYLSSNLLLLSMFPLIIIGTINKAFFKC